MSNPATLIHQLASALQGALADDVLQYHSTEWIAKTRKAQHDAQLYLGERAAQEQAVSEPDGESLSELQRRGLLELANRIEHAGLRPLFIDHSAASAIRAALTSRPGYAALLEYYNASMAWDTICGHEDATLVDERKAEARYEAARKVVLATPPAPTAQPLTDSAIAEIADDFKSQYKHGGTTYDEFDAEGFARAIERHLAGNAGAVGA